MDKDPDLNMTAQTETTPAALPARELPPSGRRGKLLAAVGGLVAAGGIAYGTYWFMTSRYEEYTDDAYVGGNVVQITPQVSGTVVSIGADDTDFVKAGQVLVRLDDSDARIALDQAQSDLAKTVRQVRNLFATTAELEANVALREADLAK